MQLNNALPFYSKLACRWKQFMAKLLPASVDTITTRFLILFIFLLFIPLCTLIIFTLNVLATHLERAENEQIRLSQDLFAQTLEQTEARLVQLRREIDGRIADGHLECPNSPGLLCMALDLQQQRVTILPRKGLRQPTPKRSLYPELAHTLETQTLSREIFWVQIHKTLYLVSSSKLAGHPIRYFYALPLDDVLINGLFKSINNLQTGIWIHSAGAHQAESGKREQRGWQVQGGKIEPTPRLQDTLAHHLDKASLTGRDHWTLDLGKESFRVQWQVIYTPENRPLAQVVHILPLAPYRQLLDNFYVAIYLIGVASLFFSAILAMVAGRTITQPLLRLIRQVRALNRESVMKESDQIQAGGVLEIQQLGEAFNHMIARLRQEHKLKDDFVATLTHDLKVPLLAEKQTLSYFLKEAYGPLNPEQAEVISILKSSNQSCLSLVTGLLEVYRYESGEAALMYERFHLGELMENTIGELQALAQEKSIQLNLQYGLSEPLLLMAYADPVEIKRVLHNLISNAISNTPIHGKIECRIVDAANYGSDTVYKVSSFQHTSLKHPVKFDDKVLVVIQDSGIGFSNDDLNHLFKQFAASKGRNPMSIGLGLFNCYQVLKAHCNPLWVESTEGEGAAVSFMVNTKPQLTQDRRVSGDRRQGH